jgi:hypothetical protein
MMNQPAFSSDKTLFRSPADCSPKAKYTLRGERSEQSHQTIAEYTPRTVLEGSILNACLFGIAELQKWLQRWQSADRLFQPDHLGS